MSIIVTPVATGKIAMHQALVGCATLAKVLPTDPDHSALLATSLAVTGGGPISLGRILLRRRHQGADPSGAGSGG